MNMLIVKKVLSVALDLAESYAQSTDNELDDTIVSAVSMVLRKLFGINTGGD